MVAIAYNVLRLCGRFNAAKPLLYAGTVNLAEYLIGTLKKSF
jgi:hypothetical protein